MQKWKKPKPLFSEETFRGNPLRNSYGAKPEDAYHCIKMTVKYYTYNLNLGFGYVFAPLYICTSSGNIFLTGSYEYKLFLSGLEAIPDKEGFSLKLRIPIENAPAKEQR